MLMQKIGDILEKANYEYTEYSGCFDIIARKEDLLLLKVLENVDSFQEEQADNLKTLSANLEASPILVGLWTRRESLQNNIIYERFDIPAFTPGTLENILVHDLHPRICRQRGGFFADVDPELLREKREEKGFSQSELAEKLGVSKKNVYEHEKEMMKARYEVAKKMESLLGNVIRSIDLDFSFEEQQTRARTGFERIISQELRKKGFSTSFVYQAPFNIIAKTNEKKPSLAFSDAEESERKIEKNQDKMLRFAELTEKPALV